jgi:hypothetical protein
MSSAYFCRDLWSEEEYNAEAYDPEHAAQQAADYWDSRGSVVEERDIEVTSKQEESPSYGEKLIVSTTVNFTREYWTKIKEPTS